MLFLMPFKMHYVGGKCSQDKGHFRYHINVYCVISSKIILLVVFPIQDKMKDRHMFWMNISLDFFKVN